MLKAARLLLLVLGIGLGATLVYQHAGAIGEALGRVGWGGFGLYLLSSLTVYALDAAAWRLTFTGAPPKPGLGRFFNMRSAGEAVNKITPLASLGGEPLKAYLLVRSGAPLREAAASVAVAKNVMTIAQITFIFLGIGMAMQIRPDKGGALLGFGIFPGTILTAIIITAVLDWRLRRKGKGTAARPADAPGAPGQGEKEASGKGHANPAIELWSQVADFFWTNPRAFAASLLLFFAGWAAGALELLAGAYALGFPLSVHHALALEALLASVNMATFFIPGNAGSQEGGFTFLAPLLGLSATHGVALAILRRCREVVWLVYGLIYLALVEGQVLFQPTLAPPKAPPEQEVYP
jgi:uncharacterized protein (TIRG00374 family)